MAIEHQLSVVRMFQGLDTKQRATIAGLGEERDYEAGEVLFRQGAEGTHVYCVISGRAELSVELSSSVEQVPVHTATEGSVFGEVVLLEPTTRSASARALKGCRIFKVPGQALLELFDEQPDLGYVVMRNLFRILAGRMRKTTEELRSSLMW